MPKPLKGSRIGVYKCTIVNGFVSKGDPPKPLPMPVPPQKLTVKSAGGLRNLKRMVGLPVRRKKNPRTETWEAIVYDTGRAIKVVGQKLVD